MTYTRIAPAGGDTGTPLNLRKRLRVLARYVPIAHQQILDCGCGAGEYVLALNDLGADARGIEYSAAKVAQYRAHGKWPDRVRVGDLHQTSFPDATFDVALLNEVLEHVPDDTACLTEVFRLLRPGGTLLIFSPNRRFPFETHGVFLGTSDTKLPPWIPLVPYIPVSVGARWIRYWARNYWPSQLRRLVRSVGFDIVATDYVWQTFENISGTQPAPIRLLRPILRRLANGLERVPFVRSFGVSQVIVAAKR